MKKFLFFLILALVTSVPFLTASSQIHLSGDLSGVLVDTTYILDSTVTVQARDSLIIQPGATLLFGGYYKFQVYGYLYAVGTPADSIIFQPAGPDSISSVVFGSSFTLQGASRSTLLSYCRFSGFSGSAINCYYGGITISHCSVTGNRAQWGGGVYISHDSTQISDCVISGNQSRKNGGGVYCTWNSVPVITNCMISNNLCNLLNGDSGHGGGGLCANHGASPIITDCSFIGNHSNISGGGLTLNDACMAQVSYCLIAGNSADSLGGGGMAILRSEYNPSSPIISNCTIVGNEAVISTSGMPTLGGGLYIQGSTPKIQNTIISGNQGRAAVYFDDAANADIRYCDFYNPLVANIEGDSIPPGLGQLTSVNANGDSCDAFGNLLLNPLFVNGPGGNFHLTASSPCIDAGDPSSPLDPDNTVADIGAFYFAQGAAVVAPEPMPPVADYHLAKVYPNPFNPTTTISFELRAASFVTLTVWDTQGRLVATLLDDWQPAGTHNATFDGSGLASGIYLYRLTAGTYTATGKMVLMK